MAFSFDLKPDCNKRRLTINLLEVELEINNNPILSFLIKEVVYYTHSAKNFIKKIIITDAENRIQHQWLFYQNQVLRNYQKYSFTYQKIISEKIYYFSGKLQRYTEYDVINGGFFLYTENYDPDGVLNKKIGKYHVAK
ncbi:hypothetical protein [Candidatus Phytoplasma oryzae]|nr:hypothetical protein PIE28_01870 [Candidatus Phytoplasma oryzae]